MKGVNYLPQYYPSQEKITCYLGEGSYELRKKNIFISVNSTRDDTPSYEPPPDMIFLRSSKYELRQI